MFRKLPAFLLTVVVFFSATFGLAEERRQYWQNTVYYWSDELQGITFVPDAPIYHTGDFYYADLPDGTVALLGYTGKKDTADLRDAIPGRVVSSVSGFGFSCEGWTNPDVPIGGRRNNPDGPVLHYASKIILPETVTCLHANFGGAGPHNRQQLQAINIPESVKYICQGFGGPCRFTEIPLMNEELQKTSETAFFVNRANKVEFPEGYVIIPKGFMPECSATGRLVIPEGVREILHSAFFDNRFSTVRIPESVQFIEEWAFHPDNDGNPKCVFEVTAGSYAEAWVSRMGYRMKVITPVKQISLEEAAVKIGAGKNIQIRAVVEPAEATDKKLVWESENPDIATVQNGRIQGKQPGECDILCKAADGSGTVSMCRVTVIQQVKRIRITRASLQMSTGERVLPEFTIEPADATEPQLIWESSDSGICTVDSTGEITAVARGKCRITCRSTDGSGVSAVIQVNVK